MASKNLKIMGATIHGMRKSKEYNSWDHMKRRCYSVNNLRYPKYGAVGITVCDKWRNSFQAFLDDVGLAPSPQHTLDRYPNKSGNYEPGNVRWATKIEQSRNTKKNILITHNGETFCVSEWAEKQNLNPRTIIQRLNRGWGKIDAITTKARPKEKHSCTV